MNWLTRRLFPLLATAGLVAFGMASTVWWGPRMLGNPGWSLPDDLWATLAAAQRLLHGNLAGLYTPPTRLVTFPGAAVILVPIMIVIEAAGLSMRAPTPHVMLHPGVWLVAGPYEIVLSAVALFAADAIAERLGAARRNRLLLACAGAVALWSVAVRWGHPEDPVAVGLLLYAILALADSAPGRAAWLTGAAVAIQPLVLLALPVLLMAIPPRRVIGFLARAAAPTVVLVGAAAAANWHATISAVTSQPNWVTVDQVTPWAYLAPHTGHGQTVAAGPSRILAVLVACGCAVFAGRRWRADLPTDPRGDPHTDPRADLPTDPRADPPAGLTAPWSRERLEAVLWWAAVALALRSAFEPVMVAYYLWPALAVALAAVAAHWPALMRASLVAAALTLVSQLTWYGPWTWWGPMIILLGLTIFFARVPAVITDSSPPRVQEVIKGS